LRRTSSGIRVEPQEQSTADVKNDLLLRGRRKRRVNANDVADDQIINLQKTA
jgi:hypothetical protein